MPEQPANDVDVIVIGAGAAGLAATRSLLAAGCKVATLEARSRIGGRAWTEHGHTPFDHGASFIHAEPINPWTTIARRLRVPTTIDPRRHALFVGSRPASATELAAHQAARARARDQVMATAQREGTASIADAVHDAGPWAAHAHMALGPRLLGAENHDADATDFAQGVGGRDRLVASGYGDLVSAYGRGLPVTLEAAVQRINYSGKGVRVESTRGRLRGRLAIVTLPQGVLAAERVRFEPPLPTDRLRAIDALPMGLLAKLALHFDGDPLGLGDGVYLHHHGAAPPAALYQVRPSGLDLVVAVVGGSLARDSSDLLCRLPNLKL
jgi:monoamine oxidase